MIMYIFIFIILAVLMALSILKTAQCTLKYVLFIVYQSYLNKAVKQVSKQKQEQIFLTEKLKLININGIRSIENHYYNTTLITLVDPSMVA